MIQFSELEITCLNDYKKLRRMVKCSHIDSEVIEKLQRYVGDRCDRLLVEYPYYDNEYLSNYYVHYAQKFKKYDKACYRIHFEKKENYFGYIVLRPTPEGTKFGKTFLIPKFLLKKKAYLIQHKFRSHIHGQLREIECFPWKRQEGDISCCAHTATWEVLKYFGNKYTNYCDTTIGDIVNKVKSDKGRETPTLGLTPFQVSEIFKAYNFSPIIIEKKEDFSFFDEVLAYVESGLPMVGFLKMDPENHAVAIIGHGKVDYESACDEIFDVDSGVIMSTRLIKSIFVMDDRYFPYLEVTTSLPTQNGAIDYNVFQLQYVVIPLYKRMQLTYSQVYNRMITWIKAGDFDFGEKPVCRIYLTSANSLKQHAMSNETMSNELRERLVSLSLPKFVWCIDFADMNLYKSGKTSGRIIVDATASTLEKEPWILKHDSNKIRYKDYDKSDKRILKVKVDIAPYDMYKNNLKEV